MDITSAISAIQAKRKAILFLGAGFSNASPNALDLPTPSGSQLSERILARLKIPGSANLSLAIDKLREKLPPQEAFDFVNNQLKVKRLTEEQEYLLTLPWTRIYTTNVDSIASEFSKRAWHDAAIESRPVTFGDFVCLHGCITNCTPINYYTNLKLGEQLYLMKGGSQSSYHHMLRQDLHECDVAFVIGYSMADPDLASLFFNTEDLLNKCFVFSGKPDELSAHRISLIGTNTELGLTDLARLAKTIAANVEPPIRSELLVDRGAFDTKEITQTARQNLLIYGRYDDNVARTSWTKGAPLYAIKREIAERITQLSAPRIAIVHSHLGNGKSLLLNYLRFLVTKADKPSYTIKSDVAPDLLVDVLNEIPPGSYVFYEGDIFAVADAIETVKTRSLVLCTTSRSTTIRVAIPAMSRAGGNLVQLFDANRLTNSEFSDFFNLIESMAFWPEDLAKLSVNARVEKLKKESDNNANAIILKIFENKKIREQILAQWQSALAQMTPIMDHLIIASYMQMIDISVPAFILNEFQSMDYSILRNMKSDIIAVAHSGRISFGNAIIAEFVLRNHPKKNDIIGPIVRFCNFVDSHSSQRSLQWVVRRLLRYWNLRRILDSATAPNDVLDRASYIPSVNSDPLFWVQYSISQMENQEFLAAERFLTTAYTRAKGRGDSFDTYQIDTHSARLTVRKIIAFGMYDRASRDVLAAVANLRAVVQRRPDDVYHVVSVVSLMLKSDVKWDYVLNENEYSVFKTGLRTISDALVADSPTEMLFASEREVIDLIRKQLTPR
jgi:hypothetical protein